jgi:integrase
MDWDLSAVLSQLKKPPFEPIHLADFRSVTYKALFLLALASIKRRSELHACTWKSVAFAKDLFSVRTDTSFVFKTAMHVKNRAAMERIVVPGLYAKTSIRAERLLCPVRAMRWYMDKAKDYRFEGQTRLFAPIEKSTKDVSAQTISSWLKKTILICLKKAGLALPEVRITAHSVRKAGASAAFLGQVPVDEILLAGTWQAKSTFFRHYLADVAPKVEGRYRLGPIAAAGTIVSFQQ